MTFYQTLTPFYDEIFPANEKTVAFLESFFQKGNSILDVGAGTGNMAIALAKKGFSLTATEPEEQMAKIIQQKAQSQNLRIEVTTKMMQELNLLDQMFQGIYCIGNTLVHLNDLEEIRTFFKQVYEKLLPNGIFIFQIVNFEKKDFVFPIIEKENFTFERKYEQLESHMLFTTKIITAERELINTTRLYPATITELRPLLEECGFEITGEYSNFVHKDYDSNAAPALIMVAKKVR